jgi:hypothetical protein
MSTSAISSLFSALQSSYTASSQPSIPPGSKFAKVDPTKWQGTWTATDSKGKPVTLTISNVSGYRATVRFPNTESGLQTGRVLINTNGIFRIGNSQIDRHRQDDDQHRDHRFHDWQSVDGNRPRHAPVLTESGQVAFIRIVTSPFSGA